GERSRLALAMLVWQAPQLLVLDEPTNHLDAVTRDALADALAEFDGALVLVSHDRYLLRATVDRLVRVHDGTLDDFDGDLEDYAQWLIGLESQPARPSASGSAASEAGGATLAGSRRDDRRAAAAQRQRQSAARRPYEQRIAAIEQELAQIDRRCAQLDASLADPQLYLDSSRASEIARERGELKKRQQDLEDAWLEQQSAMEAALDAAAPNKLPPAD
ncbi:MAG TPA: ABC transporter, partial [Burkholderiaceae bacterium]|nr:ABC transporter [Burkholderiaceae bacterium]